MPSVGSWSSLQSWTEKGNMEAGGVLSGEGEGVMACCQRGISQVFQLVQQAQGIKGVCHSHQFLVFVCRQFT